MAGSRQIHDGGATGSGRWPEPEAQAWIGLLETSKRLTRALDAELERRHGLSLSGLELLARLASAEGHQLRLSALAARAGLSLSRVSRIVDGLAARGLLERRPCREDARAVEAHLTDAGLALAREAQGTHLAWVREHFLAELDEDETATLARAFSRFVPAAAESCDAAHTTAGSTT